MKVYEISERLDLLDEAILFFWKQWGDESNFNFYKDSIVHSVNPEADLSKFYILLKDEKIVGSYALLRNDLISRQDIYPWFACLYVATEERGQGLGGMLLEDACKKARKKGFTALYLSTDLDGYYEKYGWEYYAQGYSIDGEPIKIYSKGL